MSANMWTLQEYGMNAGFFLYLYMILEIFNSYLFALLRLRLRSLW